ncbi:MAG: hypothetical protein D6802_04150 [Ardenticatenia bacterium]|nr:MAG: hypothetical protein D6802_04150 [Ardenticatenia bacterium]
MRRRILLASLIAVGFLSFFAPQGQSRRTSSVEAGTTSQTYLPLIMMPCSSEVIRDGGFELGLPNPYWRTQSNVGSSILDNTPTPPAHSGTWKAWLGGDNLVNEMLSQTLFIPNGTTNLTLSYWWRVSTLEQTHPFDTLTVVLRDTNGTLLQVVETLTDGDASTTWQQSTWTLSNAYAGQTLVLSFETVTDQDDATSFFLDDVSLSLVCP